MFLSTLVHYICFHKYTPISHFINRNEILGIPLKFKKFLNFFLYYKIVGKQTLGRDHFYSIKCFVKSLKHQVRSLCLPKTWANFVKIWL